MISGQSRRHAEHGGLTYRPHLDGLRTLAVYLVVAFHAGLGAFSGGFIGVDVFFVLSGFLVTRLLVRDLGSRDRVQLSRFYARRVRRILPASIVTLVVSAFVYAAIATPSQVQDALGGFRAAFLYVANWYFIRQSTDYFAANVNSSPVLHFWSLAVEEQFYLVWPLAIGGLYAVVRRGRRRRWRWWIMRGAVTVAALVSAILALHVASTNLDRAYYGTELRAYQLLAGAAIAVTPQLLRLPARFARHSGWVGGLALAAIVVLATNAVAVGPITRGIYTTVAVAVLIVALDNARRGTLKRVLSTRSTAYLGQISYGTYLWHWPMIVFITYDHAIAPLPLFVVDAVGATAIAALSFRLIERPIRIAATLDRWRRPVVVVGFVTSILIGVLVMPVVLGSGSGSVAIAGAPGTGTTLLDWRVAKNDIPEMPDCLAQPVSRCTIVHGSRPNVVLMGDSVARMWIPAFTAIAQRNRFTFSVAALPGCPWQRGLSFATSVKIRTACRAHQDDFYTRVVPALHPDIVLLAQHGYDDPVSANRFLVPGGRVLTIDSPDFERTLLAASASSLQQLRAPRRQIVFIEPVPSPPLTFDPLSCLSNGKDPARCAFNAATAPSGLEQFFRRTAANDPFVKSIDIDALICPDAPRCAAIINRVIVWRDTAHITATYARSLAARIEAILHDQGILRS